ncbi:MAG: ribosomal protein S18-alanine N-acetyltransferase [Anaerolineaceae bacterium]|nr:ribosomal protein S18-alanine N-acetyltransferase [Anaerolineaceae bacterium]
MKINYRQMEINDLNAVLTIDKLAFPNPWPVNAFQYELENNTNARLWIGELQNNSENQIIATAVIWIILDEAHIGTLAIHPDFHKKGIGQQFLSFILSQLISENITRIFLEVRQSNLIAINLYRKFGFDIDGERKKYYRDNGETAILMSAPIKSTDFYEDFLFLSESEDDLIRREN